MMTVMQEQLGEEFDQVVVSQLTVGQMDHIEPVTFIFPSSIPVKAIAIVLQSNI